MFIRIKANSDGGHTIQSGGNLQDGWAFWDTEKVPIPETMPYVNIEVELVEYESYSRMEVVSATAGDIPEPEPAKPSKMEVLQDEVTALQLALVEQYEENLALQEEVTNTQLALVELYEEVYV